MNKEKRNSLFGKSIILISFLFLFLMSSALALTNGTLGSVGLGISTYTFSAQLSSQGVTQSLIIGDSIQFSRKTNTAYGTYTLTLTGTSADSANLILNANSNKFSVKLGETKKISLSSSGFYDLSVKLESVSDGKAEITIQTIHELIPVVQSAASSSNETALKKTGDNSNSKTSRLFTKTNIIVGIVVIVILIFIRYTYALRRRLRSFQPVHNASYRIIK